MANMRVHINYTMFLIYTVFNLTIIGVVGKNFEGRYGSKTLLHL